ncbi:hypothetical protein BKA62DRAFT_405479 [Auriculariales sp. MPI-PUGE-AT-0066]|nr:hypothetical protein BKA62DRAFT_405479 [Auriculariales sp. MPI-PUGE-AT-0066]
MATNLGTNVAAQAGHASGVPGLSAILGTASLISDIVQRAKYNRTFLQALSRRVSECVVALAEGVDQVGVASDEWLTVFSRLST